MCSGFGSWTTGPVECVSILGVSGGGGGGTPLKHTFMGSCGEKGDGYRIPTHNVRSAAGGGASNYDVVVTPAGGEDSAVWSGSCTIERIGSQAGSHGAVQFVPKLQTGRCCAIERTRSLFVCLERSRSQANPKKN
mmetsp:Transcript_3621/g.3963  ORF Transcript_3621/g.3963 Transcript_3621/m.3963 type:complete len:135 (+) Transcript_3621:85-489(+)